VVVMRAQASNARSIRAVIETLRRLSLVNFPHHHLIENYIHCQTVMRNSVKRFATEIFRSHQHTNNNNKKIT
jgi:RNase P protein component